MNLARTPEQEDLARTVRGLLDKHSSPARVRAAMESEHGFDETLWRALSEQVGVAALAVPEQYDGFGASLVETSIVLEELGANLAPTPLLANALRVSDLLLNAAEDQRAEQLPALAAGEIVSFDLGDIRLEPTEPEPTLDRGQRLGRLRPQEAGSPAGGAGVPSESVRDITRALISALQVGVMQRALDMTVAYSLERHQFGRPIGSFQALKHRMADMLVRLEASRSASWAACAAAAAHLSATSERSERELARLAAVAAAQATQSGLEVAGEMIQLHGGIAITWEHDAHLVFKRAHALGALQGPPHLLRSALV